MIQKTPILKAKLYVPDTSHCILRQIGHSLEESMLQRRLTTLIAGPGFGKTTLAAQALEQIKAHRVWLRLDRADRDVSTFFNGLAQGFRTIFPAFRSPGPKNRQGGLSGRLTDETLVR